MKRATFITWEQLKVGGIILVALAILTVAVFKLGEAANLFSKRYTLVALLPSANGLRVGGSVTVAGQLAGTVAAIDFLPPDADTSRNLKVTVQIDQAVQKMHALKTHPREETVNRLLLRRAERVYRELSHGLREQLSFLLDGFETALAMQEPETIDRHREALEQFLDRWDGGEMFDAE